MKYGYRMVIHFIIIAAFGVFAFFQMRSILFSTASDTSTPLTTTPWRSIGGCGVGGSGGSAASSGIRWIGNGVKGYLFSCELLPLYAYGSTPYNQYSTGSFAPRIAFHPTWNTDIALTVPAGLKTANVQYRESRIEEQPVNGGLGDITADFRQSIGSNGAITLLASLTFPTGRYDADNGATSNTKIYPNGVQMGRGVYSVSIGGGYTFDFENRIVFIEGSFSYPFNVRFDKRNEYLDSDYKAYRDATANRKRFYYNNIIKPYGESDRGDYYPPSIQLFATYSWHRKQMLQHSLQWSFDVPLGTQWIHHHDPTLYDPIPDPDHRAWNMIVAYGIEYSRFRFPIFVGVGVPLHDKRGIDNRWDGIDTRSLFREWVVTTGLTVGLF